MMLCATYILCTLVTVAMATKPNFVVMLMDDMGWGDLGVYGHPARETPNLDKMAAEGLLFTDFYSASPICSPSRASLLTGRLPIRNGFYTTNAKAKNAYTPQVVIGGIQDSEVLFSEILQQAGYRNKIIGKWHLGHRPQFLPHLHGFDEWFGAPNCHYKYDDKTIPNIPLYRNEKMIGRYYDDIKIDQAAGVSNLTQMYIKEALVFIEKQTSQQAPFMLYWTPDATHTPLYASDKYRGKSKRGLYGDAVMELDDGVGQILAKIKELKIDNNTIVFFSSDNGAATYANENGGSTGPFLCGKQTTFEGGQREPGLVWWPGKILPGKTTGQVGSLMDIFPTLLDVAGIPYPEGVQLDGHTLTSTLFNNKQFPRSLFYYRGDTLFKVRVGDYKAHLYTVGTPPDARMMGYDYCPGESVENVTTKDVIDHTQKPLLFHLGRDPGEKYIISSSSDEYKTAMNDIMEAIEQHHKSMKPGEPQLNMCDESIQNWAPAGCEEINRCLPAPKSKPFKCQWPY